MYGYEGYLLKINGVPFPMKYMGADTYVVTPDQETDLDDYTDNDGIFNRNVLPAKATKIEFQTPYMWLTDMINVMAVIPKDKNNVTIEYWNPWTFSYQSGRAYIPDISWTIYMIDKNKKDIMYNETRIAFIEYGEIR